MADPDVEGVYEDRLDRPMLMDSTRLIGATNSWDLGFSGQGQTVAILDTGVDSNHPFLANKVVAEACFSTNSSRQNVTTVCPNADTTQIGTGAAAPCNIGKCDHGTHVAGIAAGKGTNFSGVARDASIIAVQVFSTFNNSDDCKSDTPPCVLSYESDQIRGLMFVYEQRDQFSVAAVNMSLGDGIAHTTFCDRAEKNLKDAIDLLRSVGIATIIASGNEHFKNAISAPGCISSAISVGATDKSDNVADFSNSASFLTLLAPGVNITSSVPGTDFSSKNGTSMATPHVTGAFALLRSKSPGGSVDSTVQALANTGILVTDAKNDVRIPRIRVDAALNATETATIGVIKHDQECFNDEIFIHMDDEDDDNKSSQSNTPNGIGGGRNTEFRFCREPVGGPYPPLVHNSFDYAVLKLSAQCPPGTFAFRRHIDNEDDKNKNSVTGDISPSTIDRNSNLEFCFVPASASGWDKAGEPWSQNSGVFARQPDSQNLSTYTFGSASSDDEDDDNNNSFEWYTTPADIQARIQQIIEGGRNTRFWTAYQTGATLSTFVASVEPGLDALGRATTLRVGFASGDFIYGGFDNPRSRIRVLPNRPATVFAIPKLEYKFRHWILNGQIMGKGQETFTFKMPDADVHLIPVAAHLGDLDGNLRIDCNDIQLLMNLVVSKEYDPIADINGDGVVDVLDARALVRKCDVPNCVP